VAITFGEIKRPRRYYLAKRLHNERLVDGLQAYWRAAQEACAGDDLPTTFPSRSKLVAAGYSTIEDIDGATADELRDTVGLSRPEADQVIAGIAALLVDG